MGKWMEMDGNGVILGIFLVQKKHISGPFWPIHFVLQVKYGSQT